MRQERIARFVLGSLGMWVIGGLPAGAHAGGGAIQINEIRGNNPGADTQEYFELSGPPGASLDGLTYLVVGDGTAPQGSGVLEFGIELDGMVINPSGFFVVAEPTFTLGTPDLTVAPEGINFEDSDNVTHLLVSGFSGFALQDVDTDDDGVIDVTPWDAIVDLIALVESAAIPPVRTEFHYGPPALGPDGINTPGHIYRQSPCGEWVIGVFDPVGGDDTPGAVNPPCPEPPTEFFFGLPHQAVGNVVLVGDADGDLLISNIGSSGEDGVSIDIMSVDASDQVSPGWRGEIDFGPAAALAAGAQLRLRAHESRDDLQHATMTISEADSGKAALSFEQDLCPMCPLSVELLLDGAVVQSAVFLPPYPPDLVTGPIGSSGQDGVGFEVSGRKVDDDVIDFTLITPEIISMRLTGTPPVDADQCKVSLNGLPPGTRYIGNLQITAGDTGDITIASEALLAHELVHSVQQSEGTVNAAHMIGVGDLNGDGHADLLVDNLGSSGQDGVVITDRRFRRNPDNLCMVVDWGGAGALPVGSTMLFSVDAAESSIIEVAISETNGGQGAVSVVSANFGHTSNYRIDAVLHGVIVDQVVHGVGLPEILAVANIGSSGQDGVQLAAWQVDSTCSGPEMTVMIKNPVEGPMTLTDSTIGTVTADALLIHAMPTDSPAPFQGASLKAANLGQFTILNGQFAGGPDLAQEVVVFGLSHYPIDDGTLTLNPDGSLLVHGLDPIDPDDDADGVLISVGEAQGWSGELDYGPSGELAPGTDVTISTSTSEGQTDTALRIASPNGGQAEVYFEHDICPPCEVQVRLLDCEGDLVGEAVFPPDYDGPVAVGNIGSQGSENGTLSTRRLLESDNNAGPVMVIEQPGLTLISLPGLAPVEASQLAVSLNGLPPGTRYIGNLSVAITVTRADDVCIEAEQVIQFDHQHEAQGEVTLCAARDNFLQGGVDVIEALTVANIGSSGQDGVTVSSSGRDDDCNDDSVLAELIDVTCEAHTLVPGSSKSITTKGTGALGAVAGATFFDIVIIIECTDGTNDPITVDLSEVGSETYTTEVYLEDELVASVPNQSGPLVATVPAGSPLACGVGHGRRGAKDDTVLTGIHWAEPIPITLTEGLAVVGDTLHVIAEDPAFEVTGIVSLTLTGTNLGEFTIIDETIELVDPCPTDLSGDGDTGGGDLGQLLLAWDTDDDDADLNGDGIVNGADLGALLLAWGLCL